MFYTWAVVLGFQRYYGEKMADEQFSLYTL